MISAFARILASSFSAAEDMVRGQGDRAKGQGKGVFGASVRWMEANAQFPDCYPFAMDLLDRECSKTHAWIPIRYSKAPTRSQRRSYRPCLTFSPNLSLVIQDLMALIFGRGVRVRVRVIWARGWQLRLLLRPSLRLRACPRMRCSRRLCDDRWRKTAVEAAATGNNLRRSRDDVARGLHLRLNNKIQLVSHAATTGRFLRFTSLSPLLPNSCQTPVSKFAP